MFQWIGMDQQPATVKMFGAEGVRRSADSDEPTLHFVLCELYDKTGLGNLATEEYN